MRHTAVSISQARNVYNAGVEASPRNIRDIRLKRAPLWSRLLAIPLAAMVLPALMLNLFGPSKKR